MDYLSPSYLPQGKYLSFIPILAPRPILHYPHIGLNKGNKIKFRAPSGKLSFPAAISPSALVGV